MSTYPARRFSARSNPIVVLLAGALALATMLLPGLPKAAAAGGQVWPSQPPKDCPFPPSPTLTGIRFTGRHSDYHCGDTWYPLWAADGNLYSPWTDGTTEGVSSGSGGEKAVTGNAVMIGDDPLRLRIRNTAPPQPASPRNINDATKYELFAGHDAAGKPRWTSDFRQIKPLLDWNNNMGCATVTYDAPLRKYLMCVTDDWPTCGKMNS